MNDTAEFDEKYNIRLCHIIKWDDFDGYGFNLHAEKGRPGQYIGKVDEGSPAEAAGLKEGDRIIEVNGVNISNENHKQVVQRIKAFTDETKLLVVDAEADDYYRLKNIVIKSSLPSVRYIKTPSSAQNCFMNGDSDTHSQHSNKSSDIGHSIQDIAQLNAFPIRLCHMIKWDDFDGYGFNLHAEKGRPGQYIGKVDEGSPAEAAGIKEGDRIVEVNGVNISNENHKQVVQRIKAYPNETKLLVVDAETDNYCRSKNIAVKSSLPNVKYLKSPDSKPNSVVNGANSDDSYSQASSKSERFESEVVDVVSSSGTSPSIEHKTDIIHNTDLQLSSNDILEKQELDTKYDTNHSNNDNCKNGGPTMENKLNLNMTAKELRAQLASRKKYDPKKDTLDFKKKYEIVQKL